MTDTTTDPNNVQPPSNVAPQSATPTASTGTSINSYMSQQVLNPALNADETVTPQLQTNNANTTQQNETGITAADAPTVNPSQIQASQVDQNAVTSGLNPNAGQMTAATGNNVAQGVAAQGQVNPNDTVSGQLSNLYVQTTDGQIPTWAQGAVAAANQQMAARGMGASSIGAAAITAAVQASALPIASADAATYFSMDMQNLSNQQQTALQNTQNRQQSLLSDQAATNVASQINASNAQQSQQFMASLVNSIQTNNASMTQAASQYNATEADQISQYNSTLDYNRAQFNQQQQYAVDQSNVLWQRTINTQNTAAVNAANQVNAQNTLNLSNTALNNLWQQYMDSASWAFTASQNQAAINANMALVSNNQSFIQNDQLQNSIMNSVGSIINSFFGGK